VCGGRDSRLLHALRFPDRGYPGRFEIRCCDGCDLLFNSPRLSDTEIEALYGGSYYVFQEREADAITRVSQLLSQTLGVASQHVDARDVLEVGCAKGYLLALLKARGWRVRGVELSADAAAFARARFGLDVFTGTVEAWLHSSEFRPAPLVLSTDVVEHVTDLVAFLAALHAAVQPGGWLVLSTPNADSDQRAAMGARWLGFNPFHIWLFSRANLSRLIEKAGFDVVEAYTYTNGDPQPPRAADGLRDAAREMLRASGLLGKVRRVRDRLEPANSPPVTLQTLEATVTQPLDAYLATPDARSARRSSCRGDDLVVIARRRA
jgi:SAM-dependent methyltransferase